MRTAAVALLAGSAGAWIGYLLIVFGMPVLLGVPTAAAVAGSLAWFLHGTEATA